MKDTIIRYMLPLILLTVAAACAKESAQPETLAGEAATEQQFPEDPVVPEEPQVVPEDDTMHETEEMGPVETIPMDTSDKSGYVMQTFSASSSSEEDNDAAVDEEVRTTIDLSTGRVRWVVGDKIRIYYYSGSAYTYSEATVASVTDGGKNATFDIEIPSGSGKPVYAVYPSILDVLHINPSTGELVFRLADNRSDGSFANANLAAAMAVNNRFVFRSIGAIVAFKTNIDLYKVKFRATPWNASDFTDSHAISGGISVIFNTNGTLNTCEPIKKYTPNGGSETSIDHSFNAITKDGATLPKSDGFYFLPVRPGSVIYEGFEFMLAKDEFATVSAAFAGNKTLARKSILKLGTINDKVQSDYYFSPSGTGNKSGKDAANSLPFSTAKAMLERGDVSTAMKLNGATFHLASGTYTLTETISPRFGYYHFEKYPSLTIEGESGTVFGAGSLGSNNMFAFTDGGDSKKGTGDITFKNIKFTSARAKSLFRLTKYGSKLIFDNCTFQSNTADNGACIFMDGSTGSGSSAPQVTLTNCTFTSNSVSGKGGAIYQTVGTLAINGGTFSSHGAASGGVVAMEGSSTRSVSATISGAGFSGNASAPLATTDGGGVIYMDGGSSSGKCVATVSHCTFTRNSSQGNNGSSGTANRWGRGGVIFLKNYASATFNATGGACSFGNGVSGNGNDARYGGVACLYGSGTSLTISDSNGYYNMAGTPSDYPDESSTAGGCFYLESATGATLSVTGGIWSYNQSQNNGGVFNAGSGTINVYGGTYSYNKAGWDLSGNATNYAGRSGAVFNLAGSAAITVGKNGAFACSLSNNTAGNNGGVARMDDGGTLTLTDCNCASNTATNGGLAYITGDTAILTMVGGEYSANSASQYGGAVFANEGRLNINQTGSSSTTFSGNHAKSGGVFYARHTYGVSAYHRANISRSTFTGNYSEPTTVYEGGGVMCLDGQNVEASRCTTTFSACTFKENYSQKHIDNTAVGRGGVILQQRGTQATFNSACVFGDSGNSTKGNNARYGGIACLIQGEDNDHTAVPSSLTVTDCSGYYNKAIVPSGYYSVNANGGGCFYLQDALPNTLTVTGGTWSGSSANHGGVVCVDNAVDTYDDSNAAICNFSGVTCSSNQVSTQGGFAFIRAGKLNLSGTSYFRSNQATTLGGVIYQRTGSVTSATDCTFGGSSSYGNSGSNGGVLYMGSGAATFTNCEGSYNVATSTEADEGGGFAYVKNGGLLLTKTTGTTQYSHNQASGNGGVVYVYTTTGPSGTTGVTLDNITCSYNAAAKGGVAYVKDTGDADAKSFKISGGTFSYNSATSNRGGFIASTGGTVNISGSAVSNNTHRAIYDVDSSCEYRINGALFSGNTATADGAAIYTQGTSSGKIYVNATSFYNNLRSSGTIGNESFHLNASGKTFAMNNCSVYNTVNANATVGQSSKLMESWCGLLILNSTFVDSYSGATQRGCLSVSGGTAGLYNSIFVNTSINSGGTDNLYNKSLYRGGGVLRLRYVMFSQRKGSGYDVVESTLSYSKTQENLSLSWSDLRFGAPSTGWTWSATQKNIEDYIKESDNDSPIWTDFSSWLGSNWGKDQAGNPRGTGVWTPGAIQ